ncbi:MAG: hypothetical protein ACR2NH_07005 [Solirubrobacteraceae bacterium]
MRPPFEVYVNGVVQAKGTDYELRGRELLFAQPLAQEGKLGFWRWFMGAWGIGTYRANHTVDVRYQADGRTQVAHALPVLAPDGSAEGA